MLCPQGWKIIVTQGREAFAAYVQLTYGEKYSKLVTSPLFEERLNNKEIFKYAEMTVPEIYESSKSVSNVPKKPPNFKITNDPKNSR